jgi:peroxiredoxin
MSLFKVKRSRALLVVATLAVASPAFAHQRAGGPVTFSLRSVDGQTVTSDSLKGEVVVLAFGASWLPLSKTQLQGVRKLADEYAGRGVVVYWVSTESEDAKSKNYASDDQLQAFARKYSLKVTVLRDPDGVTSRKFGVDQLPSIIILDKGGSPVGGPIGGLDPQGNLAAQLAPILDKVL